MDKIQITEIPKKIKWNKRFAWIGVLLSLILSCAMIIVVGLNNEKLSKGEQRMDKVVEKKWKKPANDTTCCMLLHKEESVPTEIIETNYDNTTIILLYISIMAFVFLSFWGSFSVLIKVLKSENEIISKILDVQKDIYKEQQMDAILKDREERKWTENENKEKYVDIKNKIDLLKESIDVTKHFLSEDKKKEFFERIFEFNKCQTNK